MYTYSDLQTAGFIFACKERTCKITGLPLYNDDFIAWAKQVFSYFGKQVWKYLKRMKASMKKAWGYILQSAKDLDIIQAARRKARYLDEQRKQETAKVAFSFTSVPVIASERQTGSQLQRGKSPRQTFSDVPVIRERLSKNTWVKAKKQ